MSAFDPFGILRVLSEHDVRYVVIGGVAAGLRGSPVLTGDLDVCYARDDDNLERLVATLRELGAELRGPGVPDDLPFRLDALTLRHGDSFTFSTTLGDFDILATPSGTRGHGDLDVDASDFEVAEGVVVRVVSVEDLMRMKRASGREKDRIHLEHLGALRDELERRGLQD